jgi:hypothetical protein
MDRRRFLSLFGVGVAGLALDQAIPLGRVWSFPKEIVIAELDVELITLECLRILRANLKVSTLFHSEWDKDFSRIVPHRIYSGAPPGLPPVAQLKSAFVPETWPARGIPES